MTRKLGLLIGLTLGSVGLVSVGTVATVLLLAQQRDNVNNLKISPNPGTINISQEDLDAITLSTTPIKNKVISLSKLFKGINETNIKNIDITKTSNTEITLKASGDFFFNSENIKSIKANFKIVNILNITPKKGTINISQEDIDTITSTTTSDDDKVIILSKLFDGVDSQNIANFRIEKTSNTVITLFAKEGFAFGSSGVNSIKINIKIRKILDIKPKSGTININQEDINMMISTTASAKERATALSKLFDGVTERNVINVRAVKTSNTLITLNAINGYTFGSGTITSIKANIKIITFLDIKPKTGTINIVQADIDTMISTTASVKEREAALLKLFDGIAEWNVIHVKATKTSDTEITLTALNGYTFGTGSNTSIKANFNIVIMLNITPKKTIGTITEDDLQAMMSPTNSGKERAEALSKLFDGVTEGNVASFTVERPTTKEILLKAIKGYAFGESLISSVKVEINKIIGILKITAKTGTISVPQIEVDAMLSTSNSPKERAAALSKLFNGIDEKNVINITVEKKAGANIIILTANDGYLINNNSTLESISYTIGKNNLIIIAKQSAGGLNIWEVEDLEKQQSSQQLNALKKLFDGADLIAENQANFTVSVNKTTRIVTLTAKENYTINNQASLNSNEYKDIKINLGINNRDHVVTFDRKWDIALKTPSPTITADQVAALGYLFQFLTSANAKNLTYVVTADNIVTITAKPGYTFVIEKTGQEVPSLTSFPYKTR
ncbi:MAG: hypothetical protein ACRC9U_02265 [Metamycoplasmataceae bacterium]